MLFDVVLPSVVSLITVATVWLYAKLEDRVKPLLGEKKFSVRHSVFLVVVMGVMITMIVFVPQQAIQLLFLTAYSFVLFLFAYITLERWYLAILCPMIFVALYFSPFWNFLLLDIFAVVFAVLVSVYLGGLFSWKTVLVFAAVITVYDFIQVFATGFMGAAAGRFVQLRLPVLLQVPTFPRLGWILLGLGDIFLSGLLAIQTALKYGKKGGIISAITTGFAFFLFEIAILNFEYAGFFPATLVVVLGWLAALAVIYPKRQRAVGVVGGITCFFGALVIGIVMFNVTVKSFGSLPTLPVALELLAICVLVVTGFRAFIIPHAARAG